MKFSISSSAIAAAGAIAALSIDITSAFAPGASTIIIQQQQQQQQRSFVISSTTPSSLFSSNDNNENDWSSSNSPSKSAMIGGAGVNNAGEPPFEIRGFSLGNLIVGAGVLVTALSFAEYLGTSGSDGPTLSGLGFVYGIPIFLAGAALKYAEIEPVPCYSSSPAAEAIFEKKATEIIKKIKQDVTRHRYGDEAHLDTTVKKLGLVVPGKAYPQLKELRQEVTEDGELAFTMVWQSLDTPYKLWAEEKRRKRYETFFGPGVGAEVVKIDAEQRMVGIRLTTGGPLSEEYLESKKEKSTTTENEVVVA
ncbi:hypothetical protein ACHAXH_002888 [Discostella pseudostelligera]